MAVCELNGGNPEADGENSLESEAAARPHELPKLGSAPTSVLILPPSAQCGVAAPGPVPARTVIVEGGKGEGMYGGIAEDGVDGDENGGVGGKGMPGDHQG